MIEENEINYLARTFVRKEMTEALNKLKVEIRQRVAEIKEGARVIKRDKEVHYFLNAGKVYPSSKENIANHGKVVQTSSNMLSSKISKQEIVVRKQEIAKRMCKYYSLSIKNLIELKGV